MAKEKLEVIKKADISNNCPECFNQDLEVSFYQKHKYGRLHHRITNEVSSKIRCNKCGSDIYPVNWTDDIERSFEYYQKMVEPKRSSIRFTFLFYMIITFLILAIGVGYYLISEGIIQV